MGQAESEGGCTYYPSVGQTICEGDETYEIVEKEYFKGGLGPVAYFLRSTFTSSGGNFYTAFTSEHNLGLVDTSLLANDGFVPKLPPWIRKADMPTPRWRTTAAVVDRIIYVIGGITYTPSYTILDTVEAYNPETNTWFTKSSLPVPRSGTTSTVVNGLIYVIGGSDSGGYSTRVDVYNPVTDSWSTRNNMPHELFLPKSAPISDLGSDTWWSGDQKGGGTPPEDAQTMDPDNKYLIRQFDDLPTEGHYLFWEAWYQIEDQWDYIQLEISLDSTNGIDGEWAALPWLDQDENIVGIVYEDWWAQTEDWAGAQGAWPSKNYWSDVGGEYDSIISGSKTGRDPYAESWQLFWTYLPAAGDYNGPFWLRFRYMTDWENQMKGFWLNQIFILDDAENLIWEDPCDASSDWISVGNKLNSGDTILGAGWIHLLDSGSKIVVVGGDTSDNEVWIYNPQTDTWSQGTSSVHLLRFGLAATDSHLYIMGHYVSGFDSGFRGTTLRYETSTDEWIRVASMNVPRTDVEAATVNGTIYAIGGYNAHGELRDVEAYDPNTDQWIIKSSMPTVRYGHAVAVVDDKIYVIGGINNDDDATTIDVLNVVEVYDPIGD